MCNLDDDYDNNYLHDFYTDYSNSTPLEDSDKCRFCARYAEYMADELNLCMLHFHAYTAKMDSIHEELIERKQRQSKF